jgi:hypothetical protein
MYVGLAVHTVMKTSLIEVQTRTEKKMHEGKRGSCTGEQLSRSMARDGMDTPDRCMMYTYRSEPQIPAGILQTRIKQQRKKNREEERQITSMKEGGGAERDSGVRPKHLGSIKTGQKKEIAARSARSSSVCLGTGQDEQRR